MNNYTEFFRLVHAFTCAGIIPSQKKAKKRKEKKWLETPFAGSWLLSALHCLSKQELLTLVSSLVECLFCILLQPGFIDYIVFIQFCIIKNKIPLVRTRGPFLTTTKTRACLSFASQSFRYHDETVRGLLRSNEGK